MVRLVFATERARQVVESLLGPQALKVLDEHGIVVIEGASVVESFGRFGTEGKKDDEAPVYVDWEREVLAAAMA